MRWTKPGAPWHQCTSRSLSQLSREAGKFPEGICRLSKLSMDGWRREERRGQREGRGD